MTEQYEEPGDGFFEPPAPLPPPEGGQFPERFDPGRERSPLASIKVRPTGPKPSDDVDTARPEPTGLRRLSKGMILNGNTLVAAIGGGKSPDVWQASHPEHGVTLVKVVAPSPVRLNRPVLALLTVSALASLR